MMLAHALVVAGMVAAGPTMALAQKGVPAGNPNPEGSVRAVHLDAYEEGQRNAIELDGVGAFILTRTGDGDETFPIFVVETLGGEVLRFEGTESYFSFLPVSLSIAHLDPSTETPEVIATSYTGGAHCCEHLQIAAQQPDGSWAVIEAGFFDGGYALEDPDGDGVGEIQIADQSFLYTFDCYACSLPPARYFRVIDGALVDASGDPALRPAFAQAYESLELTSDRFSQPGWLAGWAGMRARLGEGEQALAEIASSYSGGVDSYEICTTGGSTFDCASEDIQEMRFVEFLRFHLAEQGYLERRGKS